MPTYDSSQRKQAAELTHARVAQAAWELLSQMKSPGDFSMSAVAESAGVSRATVFACVVNKAGAIAAAFEYFSTVNDMADLSAEVNLPRTATATRVYCDTFVDFYAEHRAVLSRVRAYAALDDVIGEVVHSREKRRRLGVGHLLARHARDATISLTPAKSKAAIDRLVAMFGFDLICALLDSAGSQSAAKRQFFGMIQTQIDATLAIDGAFH